MNKRKQLKMAGTTKFNVKNNAFRDVLRKVYVQDDGSMKICKWIDHIIKQEDPRIIPTKNYKRAQQDNKECPESSKVLDVDSFEITDNDRVQEFVEVATWFDFKKLYGAELVKYYNEFTKSKDIDGENVLKLLNHVKENVLQIHRMQDISRFSELNLRDLTKYARGKRIAASTMGGSVKDAENAHKRLVALIREILKGLTFFMNEDPMMSFKRANLIELEINKDDWDLDNEEEYAKKKNRISRVLLIDKQEDIDLIFSDQTKMAQFLGMDEFFDVSSFTLKRKNTEPSTDEK